MFYSSRDSNVNIKEIKLEEILQNKSKSVFKKQKKIKKQKSRRRL
jgi:hypothetical protein